MDMSRTLHRVYTPRVYAWCLDHGGAYSWATAPQVEADCHGSVTTPGPAISASSDVHGQAGLSHIQPVRRTRTRTPQSHPARPAFEDEAVQADGGLGAEPPGGRPRRGSGPASPGSLPASASA